MVWVSNLSYHTGKDLANMRKNFQIKLEPKAHAHLKFRAKQLGLTLGELVENLISLMEIRVEKACDTLNVNQGLIDDRLLKILLRDNFSIDKSELEKELSTICQEMPKGFNPSMLSVLRCLLQCHCMMRLVTAWRLT